MLPFGAAAFLSAFLLFLVQPLMGRYVLPSYGGAPAAWSIALLFFQCALLTGYAYAHVLSRWTKPRTQATIHAAVLLLAALTLPIDPSSAMASQPEAGPTISVLTLLVRTVGLPLVALAATAPLLQAWVVGLRPGRPPWRMYAISNGGSLGALLAYPVLVEPSLGRDAQAAAWSLAFVVFVALAMGCVLLARRLGPGRTSYERGAPVGRARRVVWMALAACGVWMLMSVTNRMTLDLAPVPLLWVLPLSLYLVSFVVTFAGDGGYRRRAAALVLPLSLTAFAYASSGSFAHGITARIAVYAFGLAGTCWVVHGELYRLRPAVGRLTDFYLSIAVGGVLGGAFVGLAAPNLLPMYWEFQIGQALVVLAVLGAVALDPANSLTRFWRGPAWFSIAAVTLVWASWTAVSMVDEVSGTVAHERSYFGVARIFESDGARRLIHGTTNHGMQWTDPELRGQPVAYYSERSGVGRWLASERPDRRIGVIGLGTGTLAAWGRPGDAIRFYEIDRTIERIARDHFWYVDESAADVEVVIGDGRSVLDREPAQRFDLLVLDAFNSDSIPVHLLTVEAFEVYRRHLAPGAVIAAHITNRYVDLVPVVVGAGRALGMHAVRIVDLGVSHQRTLSSEWIMLSDDPAVLAELDGLPIEDVHGAVWTDDFSNVLAALR